MVKKGPGIYSKTHLLAIDLGQRIIFIEDLECLLLIVSSERYFNLSGLHRSGCKR